jgi:hypothetical protein
MTTSNAGTPDPADRVGAGFDFTDPNSPLAPYYLRSAHVAVAGVVALVFVVTSHVRLWYTDVWAHTRYGKYMAEHFRLPEREMFCDLADQSQPYVNYQWLSQLATYGTYSLGAWLADGEPLAALAGGVEALRGLYALLVACRLALLAGALWRVSGSGWLTLAGVVLTIGLSLPNLSVLRPQTFAEILLPALLLLLSQRTPTVSGVAAIVGIMTLWANVHGSYLVGAACLGCACVSALAGAATRQIPWTSAGRVAAAAVLGGAMALLANPHGPWLLVHTLELSRQPNIADMDEWNPIAFDSPWGVAFSVSLAILGITFLLRWISATRMKPDSGEQHPVLWSTPITLHVPLMHWLLLGIFGIQTLQHNRFMSWWVLLVPWVLVWHWRAIAEAWKLPLFDQDVPSFRKTLLAASLVLVLLVWSAPAQWLLEGKPKPLARSLHEATPWQFVEELRHRKGNHYPALAQWLRERYDDKPFSDRIYTTETLGDYLVWAVAPETRFTMYTHVHLFPRQPWLECVRVKAGAPDWEAILQQRGVTLILAEAELFPGLRRRLLQASDRWQILVDETGTPQKRDWRGRILIAGLKTEARP